MSFVGNSLGLFDAFKLAWGLILSADGRAALRAGPEVGAMEITRRSIKILSKGKRFREAGQEAELLAAMHRKRGERDRALDALLQAVELFPENWRARQFLAIELLKKAQEDAAEAQKNTETPVADSAEAQSEEAQQSHVLADGQNRTIQALAQTSSLLQAFQNMDLNSEFAPTVALMTELAGLLQSGGHTLPALECAEAAVDLQASAQDGQNDYLAECLETLAQTWQTLGYQNRAVLLEAKAADLRRTGMAAAKTSREQKS